MEEEFWLGSKRRESCAASGTKHYFNIMKSAEPKGTCGVLVKANINKLSGLLCFLQIVVLTFSESDSASGGCCIPVNLRSPLTWLLLYMLFVWYGHPAPLSPITLSSPQP